MSNNASDWPPDPPPARRSSKTAFSYELLLLSWDTEESHQGGERKAGGDSIKEQSEH